MEFTHFDENGNAYGRCKRKSRDKAGSYCQGKYLYESTVSEKKWKKGLWQKEMC